MGTADARESGLFGGNSIDADAHGREGVVAVVIGVGGSDEARVFAEQRDLGVGDYAP
jgi:hypothetical protein